MRPSATAVPVSCAKAPYEGQPTAASRPGAPDPVPLYYPPAPGTWVMPVSTRKLLCVGGTRDYLRWSCFPSSRTLRRNG